jgi:tetratricopeptide (TPR) repeat protein
LIRSEQIEWLPVLDRDYENLRSAFEWAMSKESAEPALNLCKALGWFWEIRCHWLEGSNWVKRALVKPAQDANKNESVARTRALYTHVMLQWQLNTNSEHLLAPAEASLKLALEGSDKRDIAIAKFFLAAALLGRQENGDPGRALLEQSFAEFQELNEPFWQARVFQALGYFLPMPAGSNYQDRLLWSIELARKAGERLVLADALLEYADWLVRANQINEAKKRVEESDRLYRQIGSENTSLSPFLFAEIAWSNGNTRKARSIYMELEQRFRLLGAQGFRSGCIGMLGLLAMEEGDLERAHIYLEEALTLARETGSKPGLAFYLVELSNLFYLQGNREQFKQNVRESFAFKSYFREFHKADFLMRMLGSLYFQKPESSAQLLGVINNHEKLDLPRTPIEKRYCIRAEAHARKALGDAVFESAFTEGKKMSLDDALDLAIKMVEEM